MKRSDWGLSKSDAFRRLAMHKYTSCVTSVKNDFVATEQEARSAYAFIAVCDSARLQGALPFMRRVAALRIRNTAPLRGAGVGK
jgi:hypothetical protein